MVPIDLIEQAKITLGQRAAEIIAVGLGLREWDHRHLKGCCPYHKEKTPSFIWNPKNNTFKCFGCGASIDILDYYQRSGYSFVDAVKELFKESGTYYDFEEIKPNKQYRYPEPEHNTELNAVEKYLELRKISKPTIDYAGVKQDKKGNIVFGYKDLNNTLVTVKYRPSRKVNKPEVKTWCQADKDTTPALYLMNKADTTKPLLITEGEIDCLSAIEAGFYNSVSVPFGAGNYSWIEHNWEWLQQFEKIIIWSDNDDAGEKMRNEVIPRLGEYRCYIVKSNHNDINEHLYKEGKQSVFNAIINASEVPIKHVVDLMNVDDYDINKAEKIKSGINGLDKWIAGFVLGTVNVITGNNGAGKSTLINQMCICEPLEQGYNTFVYSGELTKPQIKSWIQFPLAGKRNIEVVDNGPHAPKGYYVPKRTKSEIQEYYQGRIFVYDNPDDESATAILKKMEELAKKYGVKNFVLDNLMMIGLECSENEKYTKQKEFVKSLIKFALRYNSVIHLVAHPRKVEAIRRLTKLDVCGSGDITNLAHYVLAVHRVTDQEKEPVTNKKGEIIDQGCPYDCIIDLFKNRPLGHQDKSVGVYYEPSSKRFYGDSDDVDKQYSWERQKPKQWHEVAAEKLIECPF
jgi:replicative DNA helicase